MFILAWGNNNKKILESQMSLISLIKDSVAPYIVPKGRKTEKSIFITA